MGLLILLGSSLEATTKGPKESKAQQTVTPLAVMQQGVASILNGMACFIFGESSMLPNKVKKSMLRIPPVDKQLLKKATTMKQNWFIETEHLYTGWEHKTKIISGGLDLIVARIPYLVTSLYPGWDFALTFNRPFYIFKTTQMEKSQLDKLVCGYMRSATNDNNVQDIVKMLITYYEQMPLYGTYIATSVVAIKGKARSRKIVLKDQNLSFNPQLSYWRIHPSSMFCLAIPELMQDIQILASTYSSEKPDKHIALKDGEIRLYLEDRRVVRVFEAFLAYRQEKRVSVTSC